jgi:type I restriction enzyme S subunit
MQPYPKYKSTGVDWLDSIPRHWDFGRLKFSATSRTSNVDKHTKNDEVPIRLCNYVDVYNNDFILSDMDFMAASATPAEIKSFALKKGDVLITKDSESWDDIAVPALVASELDEVLCGYHLSIIRSLPGMFHSGYLFRVFCSEILNYQFKVSANGVTRFGLPSSAVDSAILPRPPIGEQQVISDFIDSETARIDALVETRFRLLELLEERRLAVITNWVTKGLNPNVSMKDSGINWLGQIPAHWKVKRLKFISPKITVGIVVTPAAYYVDEGIPALRGFNIKERNLDLADLAFISEEANELHAKSKIFAGDLVAVRTGQPGTTAVVTSDLDGANCVDLIIVRKSPEVDSRFIAFFANSDPAKLQYGTGSEGALQQHFNIETAKSLLVPLPPLEEQMRIVDCLEAEEDRIKTATSKMRASVDLLTEYRSALITNAVIGKIDVRGLTKAGVAA